jgi:hypothetical protein
LIQQHLQESIHQQQVNTNNNEMSDIGKIGFIGFGNMAKSLVEGN